jgi:hypothetical protein
MATPDIAAKAAIPTSKTVLVDSFFIGHLGLSRKIGFGDG